MNAAERLEALKSKTNEELFGLPEVGESEYEVEDGKKVQYVVWHDASVDGVHRIVVGRYDNVRWLASGTTSVDGFAIEPDGNRRPLTVVELRDSFL